MGGSGAGAGRAPAKTNAGGGRIGVSMAGRARGDRVRLGAALVAAGGGVAFSAVLLLRHYGLDTGALSAAVCDPGNSGCAEVAASAWSAAAGIPLAAVGLAFFASLGFLVALSLFLGAPLDSRPARLALRLVALALLVDVFLLGVQAFSIGAFCSLCLWTYAANVVAFGALLPAGLRSRRARPAATGEADRAPSPGHSWQRRAVPAFWVAAAVLAAAVLWMNGELRERAEAGPDLSLLGVRSAVSPPASTLSVVRSAGTAVGTPVLFAGPVPGRGGAPGSQWRVPPYQQQVVREVPLDGAPVRGPADAPVKIVTFSDFLCPSCRRFALAFEQYAEGPTGPHVSLHYRNYPLDSACATHLSRQIHPGACRVARGAVCAGRQGKFWEYHDRVYLAPPDPSREPTNAEVVRIATGAGLDGEALRACLDDPSAEAELRADIAEAVRLGVTGTPTIFINGRRVPALDQFADAVLWELERAGIEVP